eukprot:Rmarinus@m.26725
MQQIRHQATSHPSAERRNQVRRELAAANTRIGPAEASAVALRALFSRPFFMPKGPRPSQDPSIPPTIRKSPPGLTPSSGSTLVSTEHRAFASPPQTAAPSPPSQLHPADASPWSQAAAGTAHSSQPLAASPPSSASTLSLTYLTSSAHGSLPARSFPVHDLSHRSPIPITSPRGNDGSAAEDSDDGPLPVPVSPLREAEGQQSARTNAAGPVPTEMRSLVSTGTQTPFPQATLRAGRSSGVEPFSENSLLGGAATKACNSAIADRDALDVLDIRDDMESVPKASLASNGGVDQRDSHSDMPVKDVSSSTGGGVAAGLDPTTLAEELYCACCRDLPVGAVALECGHLFCESCTTPWIRGPRKTCPVCRFDVSRWPQRVTALDKVVELLVRAGVGDLSDFLSRKSAHDSAVAKRLRKQADFKDALDQSLRKKARRLLCISDEWGPEDRDKFRRGLFAYKDEARLEYCRMVGLTEDFVNYAPLESLRRAVRNIGLAPTFYQSAQAGVLRNTLLDICWTNMKEDRELREAAFP